MFPFFWMPKYSCNPMKFYDVHCDIEHFIIGVCERYGFEIFKLNVQSDHFHLFCDIHCNMPVSKALQLFKGYPSYLLR